MVRTNQGGSILGFIVIGGVMALLLVGGAYFVRQRLAPTDRNGGTVAQEANDEESSEASDEEQNEDEQADTPPAEDEQEPATEEGDDSPIPLTGQENETPENLPETGPEDTLFAGFVLAGIVFSATSYIRSRDAASSL